MNTRYVEEIVVAARVTLVTLVLTGVLYPLVVTVIAQVAFPTAANGSIIVDDKGRPVGSALIGQGFSHPAYFYPRPSAAGSGYDASSSGGSNLGPTSKTLRDRVASAVTRLLCDNPDASAPVPLELVTTSASGLDPHLSPAAVFWQLPRVARRRQVDATRIAPVIEALIEGRDLGLLGEPRVNVVRLNLALDRQFGRPTE